MASVEPLPSRLAAEGAKIAVAGTKPAAIEETQAAVAAFGGKSIGLTWDLADLSVIDANISSIESQLGPVDILVNNTGGPPPTTAAGQDPALWLKQFQSMVLSVIAITDRVLPGMRERHWGRIITSTSSGVVAPIPNLAISNALRLSLVGWSKTLSREVGKDGITANIILPGRIATDRRPPTNPSASVPMAVVPVSVKVMLYWNSAVPIGATAMVADAASGMAGFPNAGWTLLLNIAVMAASATRICALGWGLF